MSDWDRVEIEVTVTREFDHKGFFRALPWFIGAWAIIILALRYFL